jgi:hypothetical protein
MSRVKFNIDNKKVLDSILLKIPGVVPGKMFGFPAYYIKKKLFACVYENGVAVKIPENKVNELMGKEGIVHFEPMGRAKMREWIQINREVSTDYINDINIFELAIQFVSTLADKKKNK